MQATLENPAFNKRKAMQRARRLPLALAVLAILGLCDAHAVSVTSCTDNGPSDTGNLRNVIASAPETGIVSLSGLTCSTITLTQGEIVIQQNELSLLGPGESKLAIQPKGSARTRIFDHVGHGGGTPLLWLEDLTLKFGYANGSSPRGAYGGCIYAKGNVQLIRATVKDCVSAVSAEYHYANGGGIFANGSLSLYRSTLSYNEVATSGLLANDAVGGGAYVRGGATIYASTIAGNQAISPGKSRFGGILVEGDAIIRNSTISGNQANNIAGIGILRVGKYNSQVHLINSTISGNHAADSGGGMLCSHCDASIYNTTMAFNTTDSVSYYYSAGLTINSGNLVLQSSLLAQNRSYGSAHEDDLKDSAASMSGSNNLIEHTTDQVPNDTLVACPLLGPLRNNGGPTRTHALLSRSPGIDVGNAIGKDPATDQPPTSDQRGSYARVSGGAADIGAYEIQQDDVLFNSGFDGCS